MRKTAIIIAILFPSAAFAAMPVLAPSMHTEPLEQSQSASAIGTHRAQTSDQLSMGPDPGGKTGATVTPTTTKTGQPSSRRQLREPPISLAQAAPPSRVLQVAGPIQAQAPPAVPRRSSSSAPAVVRQARVRHHPRLRPNPAPVVSPDTLSRSKPRRSESLALQQEYVCQRTEGMRIEVYLHLRVNWSSIKQRQGLRHRLCAILNKQE